MYTYQTSSKGPSTIPSQGRFVQAKVALPAVRRNRPFSLLKKLRSGNPLTQDEYALLVEGGYLPRSQYGSMMTGATVSPEEIAASDMFARIAARSGRNPSPVRPFGFGRPLGSGAVGTPTPPLGARPRMA